MKAISVHAAIRQARRPLPAHPLDGAPYRRWAAATCAAEVRHASDDFWACVHRLGLAALFDRDDRFGGHEAPYRFAHETHAFAALGWLSHLQAHESDRYGPWAAVRWKTWGEAERRDWFRRRRHLWSGFVRQVERYRAARRHLAAASAQPLAEISGDRRDGAVERWPGPALRHTASGEISLSTSAANCASGRRFCGTAPSSSGPGVAGTRR